MTDDQLRDAAARALGWTPAGLGQWYVPVTEPKGVVLRHQAPPLDWITAGALLELCVERRAYVEIDTEQGYVANELDPWTPIGGPAPTARNVIDACVMALDTQSTTP